MSVSTPCPEKKGATYFSCLLGNAVCNDDITAVIRQWHRRLSACVQAGGGHFEHHFSHTLSICRLVD